MPLKLKFKLLQSSNCKSLTFTETTGTQSVTNPTGWMGIVPYNTNANVEDYRYAKIEFFLAGVLVKTFEFNNTNPGDQIFPTVNTDFEYILDYILLDGLYTIVYTVREDPLITTGVSTSTSSIQQSFYCNVKCCIMSMVKDIDLECDCSDDIIKKFNKGYALLKGLIYNSGCGNITYFNNILAQLQKLCKNETCKSCT